MVCSRGDHHARGTHGGADGDGLSVDKVGGGLHSKHPGDMGDLPSKESRMGSHRWHGVAVRWRRAGSAALRWLRVLPAGSCSSGMK
jgi:hypothetical protein